MMTVVRSSTSKQYPTERPHTPRPLVNVKRRSLLFCSWGESEHT